MRQFKLDLTIAVVYSDYTKLSLRSLFGHEQESGQFNAECNQDKEEKQREYMPNFVSVWCDPYWSGICSDAVSIQHKSKTESCSIFKISAFINENVHSTLQECASEHGMLTLCNSIKFHFFHSKIIHRMNEHEIKRDFLYSSAIPLLSDLHSPCVYGVFNYNYNDDLCIHLPHIRLVVWRNVPINISSLPATLLPMKGPTCALHNNMIKVSNWFQFILQLLCPQTKSCFFNTRTLCRDFGHCPLFQFLPFIFHCPIGPSVHPHILFYCCFHATIINRIKLKTLISKIKTSEIYDPMFAPLFLRIIRDTIVPWTMCCFEGLYLADTSLGQGVEDQPFPFSFLPGIRVFHKDDCEGRMSEAQHLKHAFQQFFKLIHKNNADEFLAKLATFYFQKSEMETRLRLGEETWLDLLTLCFYVGMLFESNVLEVHTTVGDVNFAAFSAETSETSKDSSPTGHSFGLIRLNSTDSNMSFATILEATGWERRIVQHDIKPSKDEISLLSNILKMKASSGIDDINACGHLSDERENTIYKNICLGNDCIFFSLDAKSNQLNYGIGLVKFKDDAVFKCSPFAHARAKFGGVQIKTMDFIDDMICLSEYLNHNSSKIPMFVQHKLINIESIQSKKHVWNKVLRQGIEIRDMTAEFIESIPMIRRCLATPQKREDELLKCMCEHWSIIDEDDISQCFNKEERCRGIYLSCCSQETLDKILKYVESTDRYQDMKISSHVFMKSIILNIIIP